MAGKRPELVAQEDYWQANAGARWSLLRRIARPQHGRPSGSVAFFGPILEGLGESLSPKEMRTILEAGADACAEVLLHAAPTVRSGTMNAVVRRMLRNESGLLAQILRRASALSLSDLETLGKLVDGSPAEGQVDWRLWLPVAERSDLAFDSKRRLPLASVLFKAGLRGDLPDAFVCFAASLDPLHDAAAHEALPRKLRSALEPFLPPLGYFRDWDLCAKLRAAILRAYLAESEVRVSLLRVTSSRATIKGLLSGLGELRDGAAVLRHLLKAVANEAEIDGGVSEDLREAIQRIETPWL